MVAEIEWLGRKAVALPLDVSDSGSFAELPPVSTVLAQTWQRESFNHLINKCWYRDSCAPMAETSIEHFRYLDEHPRQNCRSF